MKRLFDFIAASIGLVLASPLLLFVALWVKRDSPGPIFYRAERAGKSGKPFQIFKFRSMVMNADRIGGPTTAGDDPRVTRSGKFIRRFKLDELSQLINVVKEDMSLVGPRPEVLYKIDEFTAEERKTLSVRPGITDWASIWNSDEAAILDGAPDSDAVYEEVIKPTKRELQLNYCETHCFLIDLKIIFATFFRIVNKNWTPRELKDYFSFKELRAEALSVIKNQEESLL